MKKPRILYKLMKQWNSKNSKNTTETFIMEVEIEEMSLMKMTMMDMDIMDRELVVNNNDLVLCFLLSLI